ncbi:helix-turn-helix domain-containing protein [Novosphingobium naphthalenivorans]|uniref:helix-turn-helix domain-containing protein n=1 Tax=Novosphingobium naphthalenivorans TaxID=273168 RepID=UPI0009FBBD64|nr:helix-turn-helix domain-containing protein [Novosphingobium naphthalenivorans]
MELPRESATERLLRQMRAQDREFEALHGSRSLAKALDMAGISRAAGMPRSVVDELVEQQRQSPASLLKHATRTEQDELARAISDLHGSSIKDTLARTIPASATQTATDLLEAYSREAGMGGSSVVSGPGARTRPTARSATPTVTVKGTADLGPMVRKARKAMKMNQSEFAAHAGVGRRFLSELESGKPSLEFDKVMACALAAGIDLLARTRGS